MKYAVHSYEAIYGGLHGMYSDFVIETESEQDVQDAAAEESLEVMYSYSCIIDSLCEDAAEQLLKDEDETDEDYDARINDYVNELMNENICYEYCLLSDNAPTDMKNEDYEDFILKYHKS